MILFSNVEQIFMFPLLYKYLLVIKYHYNYYYYQFPPFRRFTKKNKKKKKKKSTKINGKTNP